MSMLHFRGALRNGCPLAELLLADGASGVLLLRELLRDLIEMGRDISIVVHRDT
jgi:hypothetical protein